MTKRTERQHFEQSFLDVISGRRGGVGARCVRCVLWCFSLVYGLAVCVRNACYQAGLRRVFRVGVPVISVGNLTTGGTGKTPCVAAIVRRLQSAGRNPAIVSRGYRTPDTAARGNDELRVLELLCPGVPHVQNPDRVRAARQAVEEFGCDCIVLDDGFQHRRLARDCDIVLIDATNPWGFGRLLPAGLLREPISGLRRADCVMLTRTDQVSAAERDRLAHVIRETIGTPPISRLGGSAGGEGGSPHSVSNAARAIGELHRGSSDSGAPRAWTFCEVRFAVSGLRLRDGGRTAPNEWPSPVFAFCAIGNPQAFRRSLEAAGIRVAGFAALPDHHAYSTDDIRKLTQQGVQSGAAAAVTTLKDWVKLADWPHEELPLAALDIAAEFDPAEALDAVLQRAVGQRPSA